MEIIRAARDLRASSAFHSQSKPFRLAPAVGAFVALSAIALMGMTAAQATTAVGVIEGQAGVTDSGAATYSIPLNISPGTHGMQPSLALTYDSQSGDGLAGYGWTLSGLSEIARCARNPEDDGVSSNISVQYNTHDGYCLDSRKLRLISGSAGADGATYGTETESFSLITSHASTGITGGPGYFTVQTKDGRTFEYGNTTDSQIVAEGTTVVRTWALDKVTDASGNYMTYQYDNSATAGREYEPASIQYTGNGSTTPDHEVDFTYIGRPAGTVQTHFIHGSIARNGTLLQTITAKTNGIAVYTYNLGYDQDPVNGRNRLTSVQECGADGSCLPSTNITWSNAHAGWNSGVSTGISVPDADHAVAAHLMDVDGDGIADLVYPDPAMGDWAVAFGVKNGGFTNPVDTGDPLWGTASYYKYALGMDYNGDGRQDLVVPVPSGWQILMATGSRARGQGGIFTTPPNSIPDMSANNSVTGLPMYQGNVWMADFSGGDLSDMFNNTGSAIQWQQNSGPPHETYSNPVNVYSGSALKTDTDRDYVDVGMDYTGSGRVGALVYNNTSSAWYALYPTNNTLSVLDSIPANGTLPAVPFDSNGDRLTDLLTVDSNNHWQISISMGADAPGTSAAFVTLSTSEVYSSAEDPLVADYYGDGTQVALVYNDSTSSWDILDTSYSRGTGKFSVVTTPGVFGPYGSNITAGSVRVGSIEANGMDDLVYAVLGGGVYTWYYKTHTGANSAYPDQVSSITDGLGNYSRFSYTSLADGSPTYTGMAANAYPIHAMRSPLQVVSTYTQSDGIGGSYSLSYTYSTAKVDTQGHGFLGFAARTVTDSRNGSVESLTYDQAFPFVGSVTQDLLQKGNGDMIRETDNTGADQLSLSAGPDGTQRYSPFFDTSTVHDYDSVGGSVQETRTTVSTLAAADFDSYGNLLDSVTTVTDRTQPGNPVYTTETATTYATASGNYCVALPSSVTVTRTAPAGSLGASSPNPLVRVVTYATDTADCRQSSQTVASGQSGDGSIPLTTTYSYDGFGNATETDTSASGLVTRVRQMSYAGQNHEFPVSSTSVVSGTVSLTSSAAWRYDLGVQTASTDANGNVTSTSYDGFGRALQNTGPDGSSTVLTYNFCASVGTFCPAGASYEVTAERVSGATTIVTGYTAYDTLGRAIEQGAVLLGGVISRVDTSYDSFGNAVKVSKPYTGASPVFNTSYTFDTTRGRVTEIDTPQDQDDTCNPCQNVTTVAYSGFTVTSTQTVGDSASSSSSHVNQQVHDALGQVLETVDSAGGTTLYNYDASGDLIATQDADGNRTYISYDGLGHKTQMVDPDLGTSSYVSDALGEVLCQTDAKGQSIIMSYDGIGRPVSKLETAAGAGCSATGGTASAWTYDTGLHGLGLPASVTDSNGFERDYAYDSLSRPSDVTTTPGSGAAAYTMSTAYDGFGRVSVITYPVSVTPVSGGTTPTAVATITAGPVTTGTVITLDGSGSSDPNGLGLQYQWTQTGGPSLDIGAFDSAAAATSFTPVAGGTYSFQLQVIDSGSGLSTPSTVSVVVKPLAPSAPGVSANPSTNGSVTLTWAAVANVDSYNVYQSADNITFTEVQNVAESGTGTDTASITGLTNGTYYFAVGSVAGGVSGNRSGSSSEVVTLPPGAPTGMNVSPANQLPSTNYTASWTAPASGTVTTYQLLEDNNSGFSSPTTLTITAPTHSKVRSQSATGTYYYKVRACNGTACGGYSGVDSVKVMSLPSAPSLSGSPLTMPSDGNATLSWSATAGSGGSYLVQASASSSFSSPSTAYSGSATSLTVSPSATKHYRVEACNAVGCSVAWSNAVTITVVPGGGGGGGCPPPPFQCQLVLEDGIASTEIVSPAIGADAVLDLEETTVSPAELRPVAAPAAPVESSTLLALTSARKAILAHEHLQPSEKTLQARFDRLNPGVYQSLALAPPSGALLPAGRPMFAPPVYAAYAGAKARTAGGTPYRFAVQYNYDPVSGALESVSNADTGFIFWRAAVDGGTAPVDAFGHIVGYVDGNNVSTVTAYDQATGATLGIGTGIGVSSSVQQLVYSWDGFGNLKQRCDANKGLTESFAYDALNRISTSSVYTGASACSGGIAGPTMSLTYDAMGNIQTRTNSGITVGAGSQNDAYVYGDPSHPHAVTSVNSTGSYAYDANGNMTSGNGRTITWNGDNLPVSISSVSTVNGNNTVTGSSTFSYSPDLQRYQQVTVDSVAGNSTTTYIGNLFEIVSASGSTQYRHDIVAGGVVVAVHTLDQTGDVTTTYTHADQLGSSDTLTDDSGTVIQQTSFDAFGLRRDAANWNYDLTGTQISSLKSRTDRGYTFQEQLDDVGLVHMNGRVYDPTIGRFISADPMVPGDRYAYVNNNPMNSTDPTGYWPSLSDFNPLSSSSPLNPVNVAKKAASALGSAASTGLKIMSGGSINIDFSREEMLDAFHHGTQAQINFLFHPAKTLEYSAPGLGNFLNVRFNHSKTLQKGVGDVILVASVVVDCWTDGAATPLTAGIYASYEGYVTDLNGGTVLEDAEQGGIAYGTSYALGSINAGWTGPTAWAPSLANAGWMGATIGADLGAYHGMEQGRSSSGIALSALFDGVEGYAIGNTVGQLGFDVEGVWSNPTALSSYGWLAFDGVKAVGGYVLAGNFVKDAPNHGIGSNTASGLSALVGLGFSLEFPAGPH